MSLGSNDLNVFIIFIETFVKPWSVTRFRQLAAPILQCAVFKSLAKLELITVYIHCNYHLTIILIILVKFALTHTHTHTHTQHSHIPAYGGFIAY